MVIMQSIHCLSDAKMLCWLILLITILPSEGFSVGSQSSIAGYSQLPFPAASQTHLTSETDGRWELKFSNDNNHLQQSVNMNM